MPDRVIVWFSCGAASAVAAKLAIDRWGAAVEVVYCDLSRDESPDNVRFRQDVERWIGRSVRVIGSERYRSIEDVFEARRYMSGPKGAVCTVEMKKVPRFEFQRPDDLHVFGLTADERVRITQFEQNNPELRLAWLLRDAHFTKAECLRIIAEIGIELPELYRAGFKNNNCIGCVKATSPKYWALVRTYAPAVFQRRAEQSRRLGCRLVRVDGKRIFLDELPAGDFRRHRMGDLFCGPECRGDADA